MSIKIKDYYEQIKELPLKKSYTKDELLIKDFLIEEKKDMSLYYCTHNEYMNPKAKVFIIGITPGFNQMNKSIAAARSFIEKGVSLEDIPYLCKREARFEGSMRKNLIEMLGELELEDKLGIGSINELFDTRDELLHTTSMIPFATFIKGKNYTGHQPTLIKTEELMKYVGEYFYPQVNRLKDALIIPLGKSVESVIFELINNGILTSNQCLIGFPHPSGANVNRKKQFNENKEGLIHKIKLYYS